MSYMYLGSPYTHENKEIEEVRYLQARKALAILLKAGHVVYSPIVHCHHLSLYHEMPGHIDFWKWYDKAMIQSCKHFGILQLDGWKESKGLTWETTQAIEFAVTVSYFKFSADGERLIESKTP